MASIHETGVAITPSNGQRKTKIDWDGIKPAEKREDGRVVFSSCFTPGAKMKGLNMNYHEKRLEGRKFTARTSARTNEDGKVESGVRVWRLDDGKGTVYDPKDAA